MSIRVIDYHAPNAGAEFAAGLKEIGFAVISNPPISADLIANTYKQWDAFFHSSETEKNKFEFDKENHTGYVSTALSETAKGYDKKDLKEFYHYYQGGRCPANCDELTSTLEKKLREMASVLLKWVDENAPSDVRSKFSAPLPSMIEKSHNTLFRIVHYPPLNGDEPVGALRAAAHEDINLLTLLPAATAKGLQVKDIGGNWIDVPINHGWIVVNSGDMLQECSGNYYKSTTHRVLNPVGDAAKESRLSMPLFLHPRDEVVLSDRHTRLTYFLERIKELGLK